jgi:hypothetical protein
MSIYRKPSFTDTIIPYSSNHPTQQKYAAVIFLYNRLNTYQLHKEENSQEENAIHNILYNSSFPIRPQKPKIPLLNQRQSSPNLTHKWTVLTYIGRETTYISNIFKHSDIKIAYCTNTYIHSHLTYKVYNHDKFLSTGVYKLTCPDCNKAYIGQTGRISSKDIKNTNMVSVITAHLSTLFIIEHLLQKWSPIEQKYRHSQKGITSEIRISPPTKSKKIVTIYIKKAAIFISL